MSINRLAAKALKLLREAVGQDRTGSPVNFRASKGEKEAYRKAAESEGVEKSEWIRDQLYTGVERLNEE